LWGGLTPQRAAEFSFLMAVPTIAGAALLEARDAVANVGTVGVVPLLIGCAVAFVSGIWAIRLLVALLHRGRFHAFAPYCWAVGVLTLLLAWLAP
jgi:undecaprenyl-diphosphatase